MDDGLRAGVRGKARKRRRRSGRRGAETRARPLGTLNTRSNRVAARPAPFANGVRLTVHRGFGFCRDGVHLCIDVVACDAKGELIGLSRSNEFHAVGQDCVNLRSPRFDAELEYVGLPCLSSRFLAFRVQLVRVCVRGWLDTMLLGAGTETCGSVLVRWDLFSDDRVDNVWLRVRGPEGHGAYGAINISLTQLPGQGLLMGSS